MSGPGSLHGHDWSPGNPDFDRRMANHDAISGCLIYTALALSVLALALLVLAVVGPLLAIALPLLLIALIGGSA